jgi:hypothetical protein
MGRIVFCSEQAGIYLVPLEFAALRSVEKAVPGHLPNVISYLRHAGANVRLASKAVVELAQSCCTTGDAARSPLTHPEISELPRALLIHHLWKQPPSIQ